MRTAKLNPGAHLKIYDGAPHGMCSTMKDQINSDLLSFIKDQAFKTKVA
jgi:non-heme chloroperoxidase